MEPISSVFIDALVDSLKLVPLLFGIYVLIELVELKFANRMNKAVAKAGRLGPLVAALVGVVPQCGASVVGTALYTQRLVTIGTLFAVYLATSDEAIPIILANPDALPLLLPLIVTKLVVAIVVGYALDIVLFRRNSRVLLHSFAYAHGEDEHDHDHEPAFEQEGCCGHEPAADGQRITAKALLLHPLEHTLKIFAFLFVVSFALGALLNAMGSEAIAQALAGQQFLQPVLAAAVGLIPNCAASVAITEFYLEDVITFGACMAGLCSSAGVGILVLLKEDSRRKEAVTIIVGLFAISVIVGVLLQLFT